MQDRFETPDETRRRSHTSRREFLRLSAMTAAAAAVRPARVARAFAGRDPRPPVPGRGNAMPGKIVLLHDPLMDGHESTINRDQVEVNVHQGVRLLAGLPGTAAAFESLFPGLHSGSLIAIKVNCLAWNDSRWEVVRGVVSGLSMMLGGTYNVSNVTIHDVQTNLPNHGYIPSEFTFGGNTPVIRSTENCSSYYIYENHVLSNDVLNADYVINVPCLKAHNVGYPQHEITTAFKNHYGSICPQHLCNNITGMLTVNADTNIKDKTALVLTSALRGTYEGGPWEPAQTWNTFPEQTPNTLFLTTDPVTEGYWARDMINAERLSRGWSPFGCPWVEGASEAPYNLGVSDPEEMTVVYYDPATGVGDLADPQVSTFLAPNIPNPFSRETTLRLRMARPGHVKLTVVDPSGRTLRRLAQREFPAGYAQLRWDGRDDRGGRVPSGVYFIRLQTSEGVRTRRVLVAR